MSGVSQEIAKAAATWHVRLEDDATDADRAAFEAWRARDPRHGVAFDGMTGLLKRFEGLAAAPAKAALVADRSERVLRRRLQVGAVLSVAMIALGLTLSVRSGAFADFRTPVGRIQTVQLVDGSRLTLDTDTAVENRFRTAGRRLRLVRGQVSAEVAHDPTRPFVIETPDGTVTALGTRFTVRMISDGVEVSVQQSSVRACAKDGDCVVVQAGETTRLRRTGLETPVRATDAAVTWTEGVLFAEDRPLVEVLDQLSRYRRGGLHYDRKALAAIRVTAALPLDDTDRALTALEQSLPIRTRTVTPLWVKVERK